VIEREAGWIRRAAVGAVLGAIVASCSASPTSLPPTSVPASAPVPSAASAATTPAASIAPQPVSATLAVITEKVSVRGADGKVATAASGGETDLHAGDTVRTDDGRAVVTLFDGSTVELEPSTELRIDDVAVLPDGGTRISLTQLLGWTWHVVSQLVTASSSYEVHTESSTAAVRGTAFQVGVQLQSGTPVTSIETTEGTVAARGQDGEPVLVQAGSVTTAKKGERPAQPHAAPAPDRKVTVAVGDENGLVIDPLGRANGFKDGKLVAQTPGAKVERRDGKVFVTLPNTPDGKMGTMVARKQGTSQPDHVDIETTVEEHGQKETTRERVQRAERDGVGGVEIGKSGDRPSLRPLDDKEKSGLRGAKVGQQPARPGRREGPGGSGPPGAAPQRSPGAPARETPRSGEPGRSPEGSRPPAPSGTRPPETRPAETRPAQSPQGSRLPEVQRSESPRPTAP